MDRPRPGMDPNPGFRCVLRKTLARIPAPKRWRQYLQEAAENASGSRLAGGAAVPHADGDRARAAAEATTQESAQVFSELLRKLRATRPGPKSQPAPASSRRRSRRWPGQSSVLSRASPRKLWKSGCCGESHLCFTGDLAPRIGVAAGYSRGSPARPERLPPAEQGCRKDMRWHGCSERSAQNQLLQLDASAARERFARACGGPDRQPWPAEWAG
jgi:hypothetical protein